MRTLKAPLAVEETVLGINARNRLFVYRRNERRHFPLADDKLRTKEILKERGISIPRTLHFFSWMHELNEVDKVLSGLPDFVIKPAQGKAGNGIVVVTGRDERGWRDAGGNTWNDERLRRHIGDILFGNYAHGLSDRAIVEERLRQAPLFGEELFPGLPDIRVITLGGRAVMAMLRIPTARSGGKANLHQGAVGVGIDLSAGLTTFASHHGRLLSDHPDGCGRLTGRRLVHWDAILGQALRAAAALPLGYLGIDVAVDREHGPRILEVNVRPGLEIQNANRRGLVPLLQAADRGEVIG